MQHKNSGLITILAFLFLFHMWAIGSAIQPIFTFLRTCLPEDQVPRVTWLFPIGALAAFLVGKIAGNFIMKNFVIILTATHLLLAAAYLQIVLHVFQVLKTHATTMDLCRLAGDFLLIGFCQTLCWTMLVTFTLKYLPDRFHIFRALASTGWLLAGLSLTRIPSETGFSFVVASVLLFVVNILTTSHEKHFGCGDTQSKPSNRTCMNSTTRRMWIIFVIVGLLSCVEIRYLANAQSYLIKEFGCRGNYFLMMPIAIEIALTLTVARNAKHSTKTNRWMLLAGPISWIFITLALASYSVIGVGALLFLTFQSANCLFHIACAHSLPKNVQSQSGLAASQAIGSIVAHSSIYWDAKLAIPLPASWLSGSVLAAIALLLTLYWVFGNQPNKSRLYSSREPGV